MSNSPDDGWNDSAASWIASMGEGGDFSRQFVFDPPMLARITGRGFKTALERDPGGDYRLGRAEDLDVTTARSISSSAI